MKIFKILPVLIAPFLIVMSVAAQQGEVRMTASIAGATPMGQFKDLVDKTSLRGVDISILYGVNDQLGIGLNVGFQDFYQKFPRGLYKLSDGSDISAVITNSVQTIPFLATARYNFMPGGTIQPYVSAGAGGAAVLNKQYVGEYPNETNKISFAARPSAGVYIPFKKGGEVGLNLGVNYTFIPYKLDDISNLSYIGFTIGVGFPMRN
ncbi:outer membrane beta-barrel protein [Terrimonas alba]|uniref:outer membrane beta-barrel protein n=1 Tax=Terrimonas alba TaxID=3349636 RepID=UPI0035F4D20B